MLLLFAQGAAMAHAAEYGELPHDHDGIACDVTLIGEEQDDLLPPAEGPAPEITVAESAAQPVYPTRAVAPAAARAPPPRAPPLTDR